MRIKIYTKTGDRGTTSLFGGQRVNKNSARIEAYGEVDELNSQIGFVLSGNPPAEILTKLVRIQGELFVLGADLATPLESKVSTSLKLRGASKVPRIKKLFVTRLEKEIDAWEKSLPQLRNFILPGGLLVSAGLHLARAICRRAERKIVMVTDEEKINPNCQIYLNRLSDWLFIAARYVNHLDKIPETIWRGRTVK